MSGYRGQELVIERLCCQRRLLSFSNKFTVWKHHKFVHDQSDEFYESVERYAQHLGRVVHADISGPDRIQTAGSDEEKDE